MTESESTVLEPFKIELEDDNSSTQIEEVDLEGINRAQVILENARKKVRSEKAVSLYCDLTFISPTSCVVERLFSQAKLVLNDHRRHMNVANFENTLFLRTNKKFWDLQDISQALNMTTEEEQAMTEKLPEGIEF